MGQEIGSAVAPSLCFQSDVAISACSETVHRLSVPPSFIPPNVEEGRVLDNQENKPVTIEHFLERAVSQIYGGGSGIQGVLVSFLRGACEGGWEHGLETGVGVPWLPDKRKNPRPQKYLPLADLICVFLAGSIIPSS